MKVQVNSYTHPPGSPQGNAQAGMCIVFWPCSTGEMSKWKISCVPPLKKVTEFAGIPFTMKMLAGIPFMGTLTSTVKSVGGIPTTLPPHGGELPMTEQPAGDGDGVGGTVAVDVAVGVGLGGNVAVGVALAVGVTVGVGPLPPQMIISLSVQIAVCPARACGALMELVAVQSFVLGLYLPPEFR